MSSGIEVVVGSSKCFHVRTTISVYRDFIVHCDSQGHAEDIARALLHEQAPKGCDVEDIIALRNDVDRNIGLSEASAKTWTDAKEAQLPNPNWLG